MILSKKLVIIPLLGFILMLGITSQHKAGLTVDSLRYISMAKHVADGRGVAIYNKATGGDSLPMVHHPPLWPIVMSLLPFLNIDLENGTWVLLNLIFFLNMTLAVFIVFRVTHNTYASLIIPILFLLDNHLLTYHSFILTEPLFLFLTHITLLCLWRYFIKGTLKWLILTGFVSSLVVLTRYIGISYVLAIMICILVMNQESFKTRCLKAMFVGILGTLPFLIWVGRHLWITGHMLQFHLVPWEEKAYRPMAMFTYIFEKFCEYPIQIHWLPIDIRWGYGFFVFISIGTLFFCYRYFLNKEHLELKIPILLITFTGTYLFTHGIFWMLRNMVVMPDPIRFMTPAYNHIWPFCVIWMYWIIRRLFETLQKYKMLLNLLKLGLCVCFFAWSLNVGNQMMPWFKNSYEQGLYGTRPGFTWQAINTIPWFPDDSTLNRQE